jgi:hypothetical protein
LLSSHNFFILQWPWSSSPSPSPAADGFWRGNVSDRKPNETTRNLRPKTDSRTEKRDPRHGNSPAADGFWRGNVSDRKPTETTRNLRPKTDSRTEKRALTQQKRTLNDRANTENAITRQKINHTERRGRTQKTRSRDSKQQHTTETTGPNTANALTQRKSTLNDRAHTENASENGGANRKLFCLSTCADVVLSCHAEQLHES